MVLSLVTMTVGNLAALLQTNLKRMLAYSSIAHVGYMLMGLAAASASGLSSVMFYLLVYAFTNIGAFVVIVVMSRYVEGEDLSQYAGLAKRAPVLSAILTICLLSLAGLPPLAGFFSKLYLFWAAAQAGLYITVVWGVLNSAVSLYYYARVIRVDVPGRADRGRQRVQVGMAPAVSLAAAALRGAGDRAALKPVHRRCQRRRQHDREVAATHRASVRHPERSEGTPGVLWEVGRSFAPLRLLRMTYRLARHPLSTRRDAVATTLG